MSTLALRILSPVTRLSSCEEHRTLLSPLLDREAMEEPYHQALKRWFELTTLGPTADPAEAAQLHQELLRLLDEVGEPAATRFRRQWAREWWEETGVCPLCGERGQYHGPDTGRGLA
ncbi:MAG: hypothetical protein ACE5JN_08235 [Candidatus Methylomirabilia bacterium]